MKTIILLIISVLFLSNVSKIQKFNKQEISKYDKSAIQKEAKETNKISFRTPIIIIKRD
ncbi:hypothetical protein FLCU109888_02845 [Flavobacterium cucumis]|uniref:Uncharacterized protein n=1 Tax=Flavobacterium cucumis TaxID=416016 RepID=A0A1M7ZUG0_9FLAO|nr:hypothetical protein [Flavobacterium cucumis]SHO72531.1 hypothetical protein SAMN05443547_0865 [Flavobacterium cucumis]